MNLTASKRWTKTVLLGSGMLRLAARAAQQGIVILLYHCVSDAPQRYSDTLDMGHATGVFRLQMELLAQRYDPVSLDDVPLFLTGEKPMPLRPVAVTFDDGYADNLEVAMPILDYFGIRAAFYLTAGCIDKGVPPWIARVRYAFRTTDKKYWATPGGQVCSLPSSAARETAFATACQFYAQLTGNAQEQAVSKLENVLETGPIPQDDCRMLTWEQVRALSARGHVVGSHTVSHPNLAQVGEKELTMELVESRQRLLQELGAPPQHFAYPNPVLSPYWTEQTVSASRQAGYKTAVIATPGLVRRNANPLCLPRVPASRNLDTFRWNLECAFLGRRAAS